MRNLHAALHIILVDYGGDEIQENGIDAMYCTHGKISKTLTFKQVLLDLAVHGRIILKWILMNQSVRVN